MKTQAMAQRIELWPIDKLIPYDRNARTHSDDQVTQIAASILEFGFLVPILVASDAGILAGHGRLLAARQLKLPEVPVIPLDHLSEVQRRAYILADNKLSDNAGWDEELLRAELQALEQDGFNLDVVGFSDEELAAILGDPEAIQGLTDEDQVPAVEAVAISRAGDTWVLGSHRLCCGDATDAVAVAALMSGE